MRGEGEGPAHAGWGGRTAGLGAGGGEGARERKGDPGGLVPAEEGPRDCERPGWRSSDRGTWRRGRKSEMEKSRGVTGTPEIEGERKLKTDGDKYRSRLD